MTAKRTFFPARSRILVGVMMLIIAVGMTYGQWYANSIPMAQLANVEQHRAPRDSAIYASAVYHGTFARYSHDRRWSLTGYMTAGVAGMLLGVLLIASGIKRRSRTEPDDATT